VNRDFWKNRKVFITGDRGFKGSWLSLWLNYLGANVCGYGLNISKNSIHLINNDIQHNNFCITDRKNLFKTIEKFQPEIVFHLAAQPLVIESYKNPYDTYMTNVIGTLNVLEACKKNSSIKSIVNVTSDKCYENKEIIWPYRENERMGGHDPYSSSKGCSELLSNSFRKSYNIPLATTRAGNVIGGGDLSDNRIIPDIIRSYTKKEKLIIRYPDAIRPWQHVLEPLCGYMILAENLYKKSEKYCDAWNFGPEDDDIKSVKYILDYCKKNILNDFTWSYEKDSVLHEHKLLKLDINKAKNSLNWFPKWSIEKCLEKTFDWYISHINKKDMKKFSIEQIEEYMYE
jgi:CDP-glucose 4,6-dehydratase